MNCPKIRFPSFSDEWVETCIGKYIEEKRLFTSDFAKYPLYSFSIEDGVTPKTERYERSYLVTKDGDTFKIVNSGDFIMNPMNLRFGAINFSRVDNPVSVSGYYDVFVLDKGKANYFWFSLLRNRKALKLYNSIATGTLEEKKRVHFSQLQEQKFFIPSQEERVCVSTFLERINLKIDLQKKIVEKLREEKETILASLFSNKGLYKEGCKSSLSKFLIPSDKTPVDTSKFKRITISLNYGGISYASCDREKKDTRPFYVRHKGELIIGKQNYFNGSIAILPDEFDNTICSNAIMSFSIVNIDPVFLYYAIGNRNFLKARAYFANGTGQKELSEKDFLKFEISVPSKDIQAKFSNCISLIDKKIKNEEALLELYKKHLQWLMDNMLI